MSEPLTFGGLDPEFSTYSDSKYVILPIPYDKTSTWHKGSDKGPEAILEASANMELYDIETDSEPYRAGIFTDDPILCEDTPDLLFEKVLARSRRHLDAGKYLISIGGEHSVSPGACKAHCERWENVSVLQIDAHSDMRESYHGNAFNHACAMARMKDWAKPVMVGIRSQDRSELENVRGRDIFYASYIRRNPQWIDEVVAALTDNVYLTIDLDGLDPSIMPATGTPEPGGLYWYEVIELFEKVIRSKNLIGFDVVELCPGQDTFAAHFLTAKLIYKILAMVEAKAQGTF